MPSSRSRRSPAREQRQRDPERTRRRILDAAAAEFAAHGYAGTRVATIAKRAGVNQQLISYYFDSKQGLYEALAERWWSFERELVPPDTSLPETFRRYALQSLHNTDGMRHLAWSGLEYAGPDADPDQAPRSERMQRDIEVIRSLQTAGRLPAELDPACLIIALMAAAMATTTLPHVIEGVCKTDPRSAEFVNHYAEQIALIAGLLGLGTDQTRFRE